MILQTSRSVRQKRFHLFQSSAFLLALSVVCASPLVGEDNKDPKKLNGKEVPQEIDGLPLVFVEDFEKGHDRWELTDPQAWSLTEDRSNQVFGLNKRVSDYKPKFRSPHNIALIKDVKLTQFVVQFRVRSTKDTGGHRDCCVFFCHQDPQNFYYVHLGAKPDPHSGQIMIVKDAPRLAMTENKKEVPWDDDWHDVKLVRDSESGVIEIYFDDMKTPHMEVKDSNFGAGRIGLGSFDDMNDFDDIRIYGK